jgi:Chaperone of endosialidase
MNPLIQRKTTILPLLLAGVLACFGVPQGVRATDLDGVLPGGNNADGLGVLTGLSTGGFNTGNGWFSLHTNAQGSNNTAVGAGTLFSNTADQNTATGAGALFSNTTGVGNTATGAFALLDNTIGNYNTANGQLALFTNSTGVQNTASGVNALRSNTIGSNNTASGVNALFNNTNGVENTADGVNALFNNTIGHDNTAIGFRTLFTNSAGFNNTAIGSGALLNSNSAGNTGVGAGALIANTTGDNNTATGAGALGSNAGGRLNTAVGAGALASNTSGSGNIALGVSAGIGSFTANGVICIGADGANVSNSCFIGHIRGVTTANANAIPVLIDSAGQLGTMSSSRRFKKEIKPMDSASESILALNPVTFHYKSDNTATPQFGLIAEEVAQVNPDLVVRDEDGQIYTVRYDAVDAMSLNEFLKEHRKNEEQENTIAELKSGMTALAATVKAQASQIQKVSAQLAAASPSRGGLELNKLAPQTVKNTD